MLNQRVWKTNPRANTVNQEIKALKIFRCRRRRPEALTSAINSQSYKIHNRLS